MTCTTAILDVLKLYFEVPFLLLELYKGEILKELMKELILFLLVKLVHRVISLSHIFLGTILLGL